VQLLPAPGLFFVWGLDYPTWVFMTWFKRSDKEAVKFSIDCTELLIHWEDLYIGQVMYLDGQEVTITEYDPKTQTVTLDQDPALGDHAHG